MISLRIFSLAEEDFGLDAISCDPFGVGREQGDFADIFEFKNRHREPLESHAKSAMRRHPIFKDAEIVLEIGGVHAFGQNAFDHRIISVAPLSSRSDLGAGAEKVEGIGELGVVFVGESIEGALARHPVDDKDEVGAKLFSRIGAKFSFCRRAQIGLVPLVDAGALKNRAPGPLQKSILGREHFPARR